MVVDVRPLPVTQCYHNLRFNKRSNKWIIFNFDEEGYKTYNEYSSLTDAMLERDCLVASDWDYDLWMEARENYSYVLELLPEHGKKGKLGYKYVSYGNKGYYQIVKKRQTYGLKKYLHKTLELYDKLEFVDWNRKDLKLISDDEYSFDETVIQREYHDCKYVYPKGDKWVVAYSYGGEMFHIGTYASKPLAVRVGGIVQKHKRNYGKIIEELVLEHIPYHRRKPKSLKYIEKSGKKFIVRNHSGNDSSYYGTFNTLEEAMNARDHYVSVNWDRLKADKNVVSPLVNPMKHIQKLKTCYRVVKRLDGRNVYFGSYKSENTAQKVVEKLKECGWDKTQLKKIQEEVALMMGE